MATYDELKAKAISAYKSGDDATAERIADVLKAAKENNDFVDINGVLHIGSTIKQKPEPSLLQKAKGAGEAVIGTVGGGTAGALGQLVGTAKGLAKNVTQGTYGTRQGAEQLKQEAEQTAQQFAAPFMPESATGQEYMGKVAETLSPLQAFPMMSEWEQIATLAKASKPIIQSKVAQGAKAVSETIPAPKITPTVAPQTAEAVQAAKDLGINVMTSDIAKPQTFVGKSLQMTGERIPIVGTGGMRETQQAQRVQAIKDVAQEFKADSPIYDLQESVMNDLAKTRGEEVVKYVNMKQDIFNKLGGSVVETPNANKVIDEKIAELSSLNSPDVQPVISYLQDFKNTINSGLDINGLEGNRKLLGDKFKSPDLVSVKSAGEKATNSVYSALRDDIGNYIKQNGERKDYTKWKVANARLSDSIEDLEKASLKTVLKQGKSTPEQITKLLYSKLPSDNRALYANLSPDGRANARSAILGKVYQDSLDVDGQLSTTKFLSGLDKMETNANVFFKGEDRAKLDGLKKALALTKRAEEAKVLTNTGQQLSMPMMAGAAGALGGIGGLFGLGTIGAIARAYESAPVRNALIRMSKASSKAEKNTALENLNNAIQKNQEATRGKF